MDNMPENVIRNIFYFSTHPVAELVKESGIYKCLEHTNLEDEAVSWDFLYGRYDAQLRFDYKATFRGAGTSRMTPPVPIGTTCLYTVGFQHARAFGVVDPALNCRHRIKARSIKGR